MVLLLLLLARNWFAQREDEGGAVFLQERNAVLFNKCNLVLPCSLKGSQSEKGAF